jgi:hypothetical protein
MRQRPAAAMLPCVACGHSSRTAGVRPIHGGDAGRREPCRIEFAAAAGRLRLCPARAAPDGASCSPQRLPQAMTVPSGAACLRRSVTQSCIYINISTAGWSWGVAAQAATFQLPWEGGPVNSASPKRRIRPELAAAFTKSVYDALLQQEVSDRDHPLKDLHDIITPSPSGCCSRQVPCCCDCRA